jgi:uncharacterized membrane protein YagU involved in acid resistance
MRISNDIVAGAVGGTFGGLAMFGIRVVGTQTGIIIHSLPDKFERGMAERTGFAEGQDVEQQKELAIAEHLVLSAGFGAGYGLIRHWLKPPAILGGIVYGLVIYAMMLIGVGPTLGITRMPQDKPKSSVWSEIFVHLLYGTVTASVADRLRR